MKFGFVKVACCSPEIKVADTAFNANAVIECINKCEEINAQLMVFPELCLTGATCGDLFFSSVLLESAKTALKNVMLATKNKNAIIFVGMPIKKSNLIYNVAVAICNGKILGVVPKTITTTYGGNRDARYFDVAPIENDQIELFNESVPFGTKIIFADSECDAFSIGVEIGSDLYSPLSPSSYHALNGANIIVNLFAESVAVGAEEFMRSTIKAQSQKLLCGYVLAGAGEGESTSDSVFGGHNVISECGKIILDGGVFGKNILHSELDVDLIEFERSKAFNGQTRNDGYQKVNFSLGESEIKLTRRFSKTPFVPEQEDIKNRAELILSIQAEGLKKRIKHTGAKKVVLGLSGGLDSTLAIIVAVNAMKKLGRPLTDVVAITMPCFGTTSRTFDNTIKLAKALGTTLMKIDISKAVTRHLKDIKHKDGEYDVTFENAQARERTQVLMDVANMNNGLVVGTGDLSELALGWATYNGDHMSMYAVNCSVPKTLVRHVVSSYAENSKGKLKAVLFDILDTPVSPELLPAENDSIKQKTEDIVGPYVLHDFYLYNMIRNGYAPDKLYFITKETFKGEFDDQTILKWLKIFVRRFFNQQFKRSCVPDGVKVGTVNLSPRGEWQMPSDAVSAEWLNLLD